MKIILPWPPTLLSPNNRSHWAKKARAKSTYTNAAYCLTVGAKKNKTFPKDKTMPVVITFRPPSKRHFDIDNCLASIKAGIDGVALALRVNDVQFRPMTLHWGEVVKNGEVEIEICLD